MTNLLTRLANDENGATAIEYGLIAMLISVAIITVLGSIGTNLNNTFSTINAAFSH